MVTGTGGDTLVATHWWGTGGGDTGVVIQGTGGDTGVVTGGNTGTGGDTGTGGNTGTEW